MEQTSKPDDDQTRSLIPVTETSTTASTHVPVLIPIANGPVFSQASPSPERVVRGDVSDTTAVSMPAVPDIVSLAAERASNAGSADMVAPTPLTVVPATLQPKVEDVTDATDEADAPKTIIKVPESGDEQPEGTTKGDEADSLKRHDVTDNIDEQSEDRTSEIEKDTDAAQKNGTHDTTRIGDTVGESLKKLRGWLADMNSRIDWDSRTTRLSEYNTYIHDTCTSALRSAYVSPSELVGCAMYGAGVGICLVSEVTYAIGKITAGALFEGSNWMRGEKVTVSSTEAEQTQLSSPDKLNDLGDKTAVPPSAVVMHSVSQTAGGGEGEGVVPGGLRPSEWREEDTVASTGSETKETNLTNWSAVLS